MNLLYTLNYNYVLLQTTACKTTGKQSRALGNAEIRQSAIRQLDLFSPDTDSIHF